MIAWLLALLTSSCPPGWYVSTVRPSGVYACTRTPARSVCDTKGGCDDTRPDDVVWLWAWCPRVPVNRDGLEVVCR